MFWIIGTCLGVWPVARSTQNAKHRQYLDAILDERHFGHTMRHDHDVYAPSRMWTWSTGDTLKIRGRFGGRSNRHRFHTLLTLLQYLLVYLTKAAGYGDSIKQLDLVSLHETTIHHAPLERTRCMKIQSLCFCSEARAICGMPQPPSKPPLPLPNLGDIAIMLHAVWG